MKRIETSIVLLGIVVNLAGQVVSVSPGTEEDALENACFGQRSDSAAMNYRSPGAGNPLLPGYLAAPTVKKLGDTYH